MATSVESRPRVRVAERPQARGAGRDVVRRRLFLALVAVLPLHTLFVDAWVSWKPYMLLLAALVLIDLWQGARAGRWPWDRPVSLALVALLAAVLAGWPPASYLGRYLALVLALVVGALLLLVTARSLRSAAMLSATLRVIFWTGAAMGISALGLTLASMGAFGAGVVPFINAIPGIDRVAKMAYLEEGFLALTNWHQDPGYAASWMTLWAGLGLVASVRGLGTRRWWGDGAILGGLVFGVMMTFSRTGWLGLVVGLAFVTWVLVRSGEATLGQMAKRLAAAGLVALLLVGVVWANDDPDAGGHLDVQFAFRLGQVWQLASSTLNLSGGDVAFAEVFDDSEGRADVWPDYLELFRSHPWTGVGLG
ncbi:MAG: O-antigen ligase family protein, partial [Actinomycetota bacterium]|nr:O-antigen ligase family protein [Actinomycetota bacterium]